MTSADRQGQDSSRQQRKLFQALFANLPADANRRLDALAEVNHLFREAIADQLQPVVRTLLQEAPPTDGDGRRGLARRLNHVLRDAGLAVVNPDSGQPAAVVADAYRLRLQNRQATGRQICSRNTKVLPPLELVEYIRQEPISTWRERVDQASSSKNRDR